MTKFDNPDAPSNFGYTPLWGDGDSEVFSVTQWRYTKEEVAHQAQMAREALANCMSQIIAEALAASPQGTAALLMDRAVDLDPTSSDYRLAVVLRALDDLSIEAHGPDDATSADAVVGEQMFNKSLISDIDLC